MLIDDCGEWARVHQLKMDARVKSTPVPEEHGQFLQDVLKLVLKATLHDTRRDQVSFLPPNVLVMLTITNKPDVREK